MSRNRRVGKAKSLDILMSILLVLLEIFINTPLISIQNEQIINNYYIQNTYY
jgi:hypothetical protein